MAEHFIQTQISYQSRFTTRTRAVNYSMSSDARIVFQVGQIVVPTNHDELDNTLIRKDTQ